MRVKKQFHVSELFFTLAVYIFACTKTRQENPEKVNYSVLNGKTTLNQFPSLQSNSYALQASGIEYL